MKQYLFRNQLKEILPISETTRARLEKQGKFPSRKKISEGRVAWDASQVKAWLENLENADEQHYDSTSMGA